MSAPDVVVVGAGAIGLSTALELSARGRRCLVLEREPPGHVGCSAGSAGLIRRGHHRPFAQPATVAEGLRSLTRRDGPFTLRPSLEQARWASRFALAARPPQVRRGSVVLADLATRSLELYEGYAARHVDVGLRRMGVTDVYLAAGAYERALADARRGTMPFDVLGPADVEAGHPGATSRGIAGALHWPEDLSVDPVRLLDGLRAACRDAGVLVRSGAAVDELAVRRGRVAAAVTRDGELNAGSFVLAAGAWTPQLARSLGVGLLLAPGKGYHVDFARGGGGPPVMLVERRVVICPFGDRTRACGILDLEGFAPEVRAHRAALVQEAAWAAMPGLRDAARRVWAGYRPCTADGLPVLGRVGAHPNVVIAAGHGMQGIELAPATGAVAAACVDGAEPPAWIAATAPERFAVRAGRRPEKTSGRSIFCCPRHPLLS